MDSLDSEFWKQWREAQERKNGAFKSLVDGGSLLDQPGLAKPEDRGSAEFAFTKPKAEEGPSLPTLSRPSGPASEAQALPEVRRPSPMAEDAFQGIAKQPGREQSLISPAGGKDEKVGENGNSKDTVDLLREIRDLLKRTPEKALSSTATGKAGFAHMLPGKGE